MKRNFLKTSLSAFAFTLAIVASFAFSPAPNDAEDVAVQGYIQTLDPESCVKVNNHNCVIGPIRDCTITIFPAGPAPVYETRFGTLCSD
ncbi:MAG TPA: DUF6520 family protein, partial [Mariniflexile sp.]